MTKRDSKLRSYKESKADREARIAGRMKNAAGTVHVTRDQVQMLKRVQGRTVDEEAEGVPA